MYVSSNNIQYTFFNDLIYCVVLLKLTTTKNKRLSGKFVSQKKKIYLNLIDADISREQLLLHNFCEILKNLERNFLILALTKI